MIDRALAPFRWYWRQVRSLLAPAETMDAEDLASWLIRRVVARALLVVPLLPVVLGGLWGWERWKHHRRDRALERSPCMLVAGDAFGLGALEASGSAAEGRCDVYWRQGLRSVLHVTWVADGPFTGLGQREIERWDWDRDERVTHVEDGGGNRILVVEPFAGGRLELRGMSDALSEGEVVVAYLDAATR